MATNEKLPAYMRQDENAIYYKGDGEIIYYVPEKYYELSLAYSLGEYVNIMGVFAYCHFEKSGKADKLKHFKCPTMIKCKPSKIEKVTSFQLQGSKSTQGYRFLYFMDGAELISELALQQNIENVEKFMNLVKGGNLPDYIPYNEIHEYLIANAKLNGFSYRVSHQILGMIISEIYRDRKDLSKPFRYTDMKDMTDYKAINMTKIPKYTSVYTSITSENPDEAIAGALINKGTGRSPLERVMMN